MCQVWFFGVFFFLLYSCSSGQILTEKYQRFSSLSFELLSSFINNVSCSIEESLILHPDASYKGKFRCRKQKRGAKVGRSSGGGVVCTKIGCLSQRESTGVGQAPGQILTLTPTGLIVLKYSTEILPAQCFYAVLPSPRRYISIGLL